MKNLPFDTEKLKKWFKENKRDLPWRRKPTPYGVWVSEIMLQQTQASVAADYYLRWMQRFPSVKSLAQASLDEVLKAWEGLGYYSRARHLHAAARAFVASKGGEIPSDRMQLERVKGLGPYTIGAILSFAFHQKAAAVDANAARVLTRYFCIEKEATQARKQLWEIAERLLPDKEPWVVVEALIELGATVCLRRPKCLLCPLSKDCVARQKGMENDLPFKKTGVGTTLVCRHVAVICWEGEFLIRRVAQGNVMAGLYEFPYVEAAEEQEMTAHWQALFPFALVFKEKLARQSHTFTRFRVDLFPALWQAMEKKTVEGYQWACWEKMAKLPFSSGHRRILMGLR